MLAVKPDAANSLLHTKLFLLSCVLPDKSLFCSVLGELEGDRRVIGIHTAGFMLAKRALLRVDR